MINVGVNNTKSDHLSAHHCYGAAWNTVRKVILGTLVQQLVMVYFYGYGFCVHIKFFVAANLTKCAAQALSPVLSELVMIL